jgi:virulence-associated protein VagC
MAMSVIETKTFKANGQVAVYLPADTAFLEGATVRVEKTGDGVCITPLVPPDPEEERRRVLELTARLREIWKDVPRPPVEAREPIEFPDRPGL